MEAVELYRKYRPSSFKEMVGQKDAIKSLNEMGKAGKIPHVIMFTGPSGTGKTTLARILAKKLECSPIGFTEINSAECRGIDNVRDIQKQMGAAPLEGKVKIWLIDECFPRGTQVNGEKGSLVIESIVPGDRLITADGVGVVRKRHDNRVSLDRLVKVKFSDGLSQVTTCDHEFLTEKGWVKAKDLTGFSIFRHICYPACKETTDGKNAKNSVLRILQESIPSEMDVQSNSQNLFEKLFSEIETDRGWKQSKDCEDVRRVRNQIRSSRQLRWKAEKVLQPVLCRQESESKTRVPGQDIYATDSGEDQRVTSSFREVEKRDAESNEGFVENAVEKPFDASGIDRQRCSDEDKERNSSHLERETRRKRIPDRSSDQIIRNSQFEDRIQMGFRGFSSDQSTSGIRSRVSNELQARSRLLGIESWSGSRWDWASVETEYIRRCQESQETQRIRVESVEIYQQGCNDESFMGAVDDRDRDRGFVEFYDLEMVGHPSYLVNGVCVHNCHQMTGDAQNALLKMLEETPPHVYFFLATTDPGKVIKTIHTRCTPVHCTLVNTADLVDLIGTVAQKEEIEVSDEVIKKIAESADGSPRMALVLLHSVINIKSKEDQLAAIEGADPEGEAYKLFYKLLSAKEWMPIAEFLKSLKEEPETIRRMILACALSELGKKDSSKSHIIIEEFREPIYQTGKAGVALLWSSCYAIVKG